MGAQKNVPKKGLVTLSSYIFYVKSQSNIVYEYFKTKIVSRDTIIPPQVHWTLATVIGGFWVSLIYLILNFKKTVCPKNVCVQHWSVIPRHAKINPQYWICNMSRINWVYVNFCVCDALRDFGSNAYKRRSNGWPKHRSN